MTRMGRWGNRVAWTIAISAIASAVQGQTVNERSERRLEQLRREQTTLMNADAPPQQRALIDGGAYISASYLSLDDAAGHNHGLREYDGTVYARLNLDGVHDIFFRGSAGWRDFNNTADSFDGRGDERVDPDVDRLYYKFDLNRALGAYRGVEDGPRLTVQVGRDLVDWGNSLVLSQTLDGVVVKFGSNVVDVEAIAGVTPVRTVDFDSSRPGFDYNTRRGFYGVQVAHQFENHLPYLYGLVQRDYNKLDSIDVLGDSLPSRFDYNSVYLGGGSEGNLTDRLRYGVEVVYEAGTSISDARTVTADPNDPGGASLTVQPQTHDDITAVAADIRLDYLAEGAHRTRYSGELILATGDSDRESTNETIGGNTRHTHDKAFNAFGLVNTGLAFAPSVSNVIIGRAGVSTFPITTGDTFSRLQVGFDAFAFGKFNPDAPIDEPTDNGRYLGCEGDVFVNWQITSDVTIAARYGAFLPGDTIAGSDDTRQFFFIGVTYGL